MVSSKQSYELRIFESIWDYMKRQKQLRLSESIELCQFFQGVWNNLPANCLKLYESVAQRFGAVLKVTPNINLI